MNKDINFLGHLVFSQLTRLINRNKVNKFGKVIGAAM